MFWAVTGVLSTFVCIVPKWLQISLFLKFTFPIFKVTCIPPKSLSILIPVANTHLLTPRSRVLLQMLTVFQLFNQFPAFLVPEGSLPHSQVPATFSYPEPDQSSPCLHPTSCRSILILSSLLHLVLPSGFFPLRFPTKAIMYLSSSYTCYMPHPSQPRFYHLNNWWGVQVTKPLNIYIYIFIYI